jgi:AcrR family transcriptional regulator
MSDTRAVKSRRRGDALQEAILRAAFDELRDGGWVRFRIDRVAERAGTGKAAIYKRWPNRAALARDAARWMAGDSGSAWPVTGDLRRDLIDFLGAAARFLEGPFGEAVRGLVGELDTQPSEGSASLDVMPSEAGIVAAIIDRARTGGTVGPREPSLAVYTAGPSLITHYYLVNGRAPTPEQIVEIVDDLWAPALRASCARDEDGSASHD